MNGRRAHLGLQRLLGQLEELRIGEPVRLLRQGQITVPEIPLSPQSFLLTEAVNQIPTTLLFKDGRLIDRRLGAQSERALLDWVAQARR